MSELRHPGVWTPWASILCFHCHGDTFDRGFGNVHKTPPPTFAELCAKQPVRRGEGPTICDKCDREIWVREDVAALSELRYRLDVAAAMEQTGGMCAGLSITRDGSYIFVTVDGEWFVGVYPNADALYEGGCTDMFDFAEEDTAGVERCLKELIAQ